MHSPGDQSDLPVSRLHIVRTALGGSTCLERGSGLYLSYFQQFNSLPVLESQNENLSLNDSIDEMPKSLHLDIFKIALPHAISIIASLLALSDIPIMKKSAALEPTKKLLAICTISA